MKLPLQNFATLVGNAAASVQGVARPLLDVSVGSALRAVLEANASLALWLQWLIVLVLQTTRASTSTAADLDSWMDDFALTRLPAVAAAGRVQLGRFVAVGSAVVPAGLQLRTADATQSFTVQAEAGHPVWQAAVAGFVLAPGVASVDVPVLALEPGAAGNVQAGTVTLLAAALPGVDTVTNAGAFGGGVDAESDVALRQRFQLFLATRSRATPLAVEAAVLASRQGLTASVSENVTSDGQPRMGSFVVTVDDGSGTPSAEVLQAAAQAIETMRPVGTSFAVLPPVPVGVAVSLSVTVADGADHATAAAAVAVAITAYVDALPVGAALPYSRLVKLAYDAAPTVTNVTGARLNGDVRDVSPGPRGVVKAASVQVA